LSGDDFDLARIVPSTRDLLAGLAMRRRSVALIPFIEGDAATTGIADIERLRDSVRAFACDAFGPPLREVAQATRDVPLLVTRACQSAEDCQRARYHGADGVCIDPQAMVTGEELFLVARSMRMMPLAFGTEAPPTASVTANMTRAFILNGSLEQVLLSASAFPRQAVLVVDWSRTLPCADDLARLRGHIDAVLVGARLHRTPEFIELVDSLDE